MRRTLALTVIVLVGSLGAAVYLLRVEQVRVTGVATLSARSVVQASGLRPGDRILIERLTAAERRIERIPAVADAVAERSLPSTVVIHVRERVPLARLDRARDLVVDMEGYVFAAGDRPVQPVLYGWKGRARPGARLDRSSRAVLDAYERFPPRLRDWGRRLRVGGDFTLTLQGGTQVRFGLLRDLDAKARVAEAILRAERGQRLAYIDVRSPTVPVSRRRDAPTPSPTGAPAATAPSGPVSTPAPATTAAPTPAP